MSGLVEVSLFAGGGGISLAAERAGMRTVLACEKDAACRKMLTHRFPDAVLHDDVRTLTADDLRRAGAVPGRTVLTAGFPCQDVSVAGRRKGMGEGTRSGLFWEVDRLLADFRPAWVLLENVAGLLSATCICPGDGTCIDNGRPTDSNGCGEWRKREWFANVEHAVKGGACRSGCIPVHGGVMGAVLGSLAQRGYGFAYRVLDARFFGVPQRRRRVIVVGHLGGTGAASAEILLEPESVLGDSSPRGEAGSGAAAGAGTGAPLSGYDIYNDTLTGDLSHTLASVGGRNNRLPHVVGGWVAEVAPTLESGTNATGGVRPPGTTVDTAESLVVGVLGDHAHTLTAEDADAGEDGSGRGTPVLAFAWQAGGNNSASGAFQDDGTTPTLPRSQTLAVAVPEFAATLTAGLSSDGVSAPGRRQEDDANLVAYVPDVANSLMSHGGNDKHDPTLMTYVAHEVGSLTAAADGGWRVGADEAAGGQLVALHENQRGELTLTPETGALSTPGGKPGQGYPAVTDGVIVRRLTPLECERLQGAPDRWTDVDDASDSQRYRQMGNSVAVPVLAWVLGRLVAVDAALNADATVERRDRDERTADATAGRAR